MSLEGPEHTACHLQTGGTAPLQLSAFVRFLRVECSKGYVKSNHLKKTGMEERSYPDGRNHELEGNLNYTRSVSTQDN